MPNMKCIYLNYKMLINKFFVILCRLSLYPQNQGGQLHPALEIDNQILRFSKAGVTDPLKQGLSPFERIEYRYDADQKNYIVLNIQI